MALSLPPVKLSPTGLGKTDEFSLLLGVVLAYGKGENCMSPLNSTDPPPETLTIELSTGVVPTKPTRQGKIGPHSKAHTTMIFLSVFLYFCYKTSTPQAPVGCSQQLFLIDFSLTG